MPFLLRPKSDATPSATAPQAPAETQPAELTPYERVERGMTYAECVALFQGEGHLMQAAGPSGLDIQFYQWYDAEQFEIYIAFIDGRVDGKQRSNPAETSRYSFSGSFRRDSTN